MDYTRFQSTATALISRFGTKCKVTRNGVDVGSTIAVRVDSEVSNDTTANSSGLVLTPNGKHAFYLSSKVAPRLGDVLLYAGETFTVATVMAFKPTTTVIYYEVEAS